jgi:hypothetical protein
MTRSIHFFASFLMSVGLKCFPPVVLQHLEPWSEMLEKSNPTISNPPVNPFIPIELLSNEPRRLDGSKIERVVGWKPKAAPELTDELVKQTVELFKAEEGIWPNAPPRRSSGK